MRDSGGTVSDERSGGTDAKEDELHGGRLLHVDCSVSIRKAGGRTKTCGPPSDEKMEAACTGK